MFHQCLFHLIILHNVIISFIDAVPIREEVQPSQFDMTALLPGVVTGALLVCLLLLLAGCLCCPYANGLKNLGHSNGIALSQRTYHNLPRYSVESTFNTFPLQDPLHNQQIRQFYEDEVTFDRLPEIHSRKPASLPSDRLPRPAYFGQIPSKHFALHEWFGNNLPRSQIRYIQELGSGWFGKVVEGEIHQASLNQGKSQIVVKILREDASPSEHNYFLNEVEYFRKLHHPNIVHVIGQCLEEDPFLILMELVSMNLKTFLIDECSSCKGLDENVSLLSMAIDIASGLQHIHEQGFVHLDLAARNCLVTSDLKVKIGDYGTTVEQFKDDYYCLGDIAIPVRWCSPESLQCTESSIETKVLTKKTNVWSFGIVLWELFEFGKLPYQELSNDDVIQKVIIEKTVLLDQPTTACVHSDKIYQVMKLCWVESGEELEMHSLVASLTHLYKNENVTSIGSEDFESKWQALHTIPREYSLPFTDASSHIRKFENDFISESTVHGHAQKINNLMSSTDLSLLPCETPSYESFVIGDEDQSENVSPSLQNLSRSIEGSPTQAEHVTRNTCEEIPETELLPYQNFDDSNKSESIYQDGDNTPYTGMTQLTTSTGCNKSGIISVTLAEESSEPLCNLNNTFLTSRDVFQNDLQTAKRVQEVLEASVTTTEISVKPVELDSFNTHDKQNDDLNKSAISCSFKKTGSLHFQSTRTFQHCNSGKDGDFFFTDELLPNKQVLELAECDTENVDSGSDVIDFHGTSHKNLKLFDTTVNLDTADLALTDKSHTSSGELDGVSSDSCKTISENFVSEENFSERISTNLLGKDYEEKKDSENLEKYVSTQLDINNSVEDGLLPSVEDNFKRIEHTSFDTSVETERSFPYKNKKNSSAQFDASDSMISGENSFVKNISTENSHLLENKKTVPALQTCFDKAVDEDDLTFENSGFLFLSDNYLYNPEMIAVPSDYVGKDDSFCGLPETENQQFGAYKSKLGADLLWKDKQKLFGYGDELEKHESRDDYVSEENHSVIGDLNKCSTFMFSEDNFNSEVKEKPVTPLKESLENAEDDVQDFNCENEFVTKKRQVKNLGVEEDNVEQLSVCCEFADMSIIKNQDTVIDGDKSIINLREKQMIGTFQQKNVDSLLTENNFIRFVPQNSLASSALEDSTEDLTSSSHLIAECSSLKAISFDENQEDAKQPRELLDSKMVEYTSSKALKPSLENHSVNYVKQDICGNELSTSSREVYLDVSGSNAGYSSDMDDVLEVKQSINNGNFQVECDKPQKEIVCNVISKQSSQKILSSSFKLKPAESSNYVSQQKTNNNCDFPTMDIEETDDKYISDVYSGITVSSTDEKEDSIDDKKELADDEQSDQKISSAFHLIGLNKQTIEKTAEFVTEHNRSSCDETFEHMYLESSTSIENRHSDFFPGNYTEVSELQENKHHDITVEEFLEFEEHDYCVPTSWVHKSMPCREFSTVNRPIKQLSESISSHNICEKSESEKITSETIPVINSDIETMFYENTIISSPKILESVEESTLSLAPKMANIMAVSEEVEMLPPCEDIDNEDDVKNDNCTSNTSPNKDKTQSDSLADQQLEDYFYVNSGIDNASMEGNRSLKVDKTSNIFFDETVETTQSQSEKISYTDISKSHAENYLKDTLDNVCNPEKIGERSDVNESQPVLVKTDCILYGNRKEGMCSTSSKEDYFDSSETLHDDQGTFGSNSAVKVIHEGDSEFFKLSQEVPHILVTGEDNGVSSLTGQNNCIPFNSLSGRVSPIEFVNQKPVANCQSKVIKEMPNELFGFNDKLVHSSGHYSDYPLVLENPKGELIFEGEHILAGEESLTFFSSQEIDHCKEVEVRRKHQNQETLILAESDLPELESTTKETEKKRGVHVLHTVNYNVHRSEVESDTDDTSSTGTSCSSTSGSFECLNLKFKDKSLEKDLEKWHKEDGKTEEEDNVTAWNSSATPTRSILLSPEKKLLGMKKSVSFHEDHPVYVYSYSPEVDSDDDLEDVGNIEDFCWNQDYGNYADWDFQPSLDDDQDVEEDVVEVEDLKDSYNNFIRYKPLPLSAHQSTSLYTIVGITDEELAETGEDDLDSIEVLPTHPTKTFSYFQEKEECPELMKQNNPCFEESFCDEIDSHSDKCFHSDFHFEISVDESIHKDPEELENYIESYVDRNVQNQHKKLEDGIKPFIDRDLQGQNVKLNNSELLIDGNSANQVTVPDSDKSFTNRNIESQHEILDGSYSHGNIQNHQKELEDSTESFIDKNTQNQNKKLEDETNLVIDRNIWKQQETREDDTESLADRNIWKKQEKVGNDTESKKLDDTEVKTDSNIHNQHKKLENDMESLGCKSILNQSEKKDQETESPTDKNSQHEELKNSTESLVDRNIKGQLEKGEDVESLADRNIQSPYEELEDGTESLVDRNIKGQLEKGEDDVESIADRNIQSQYDEFENGTESLVDRNLDDQHENGEDDMELLADRNIQNQYEELEDVTSSSENNYSETESSRDESLDGIVKSTDDSDHSEDIGIEGDSDFEYDDDVADTPNTMAIELQWPVGTLPDAYLEDLPIVDVMDTILEEPEEDLEELEGDNENLTAEETLSLNCSVEDTKESLWVREVLESESQCSNIKAETSKHNSKIGTTEKNLELEIHSEVETPVCSYNLEEVSEPDQKFILFEETCRSSHQFQEISHQPYETSKENSTFSPTFNNAKVGISVSSNSEEEASSHWFETVDKTSCQFDSTMKYSPGQLLKERVNDIEQEIDIFTSSENVFSDIPVIIVSSYDDECK